MARRSRARLPVERWGRLPEVDRSRASGKVTARFSRDFQPSGRLSPAVPGEESRRVLRDWRVWGALQSRGVTGGGESVGASKPRVPTGSYTVRGVQPPGPCVSLQKNPARDRR
jgi:hypothetical protein